MPGKKELHLEGRSPDMLALLDALDIFNGKWKIAIMCSLNTGNKRFKELQRDIGKVTGKMLSKELKDLEINELIKRTVHDTKPVTVEYELTAYGMSLEKVIIELVSWGQKHRKRIFRKRGMEKKR
ncbi:MAG TPA: helix-turn-helix domain-containing protein [Puia sp.]|jgi:DNA-binding HxlR family transcriptional regulator